MTWRDFDFARGTISVVQEKTGAALELPIHAQLRAALEAWPRRHVVILRLSAESLGNAMADAIAAAKLPERCVLHGLRKAAARGLAEAGASEHQIAAITGHKTLSEVAHYTRQARQSRLAAAAMDLLQNIESQPDSQPWKKS